MGPSRFRIDPGPHHLDAGDLPCDRPTGRWRLHTGTGSDQPHDAARTGQLGQVVPVCRGRGVGKPTKGRDLGTEPGGQGRGRAECALWSGEGRPHWIVEHGHGGALLGVG